MAEGLDFGALWPVPAGRFGRTARGNAPCLMEIVSWLTTGAIDTAWPGVSPSIAEYVQAAQDAMDHEPRQKLLVLVPGLIRCSGDADTPEIESARRLLLAQRSLSLLVPLVLEAAGWLEEAAALRGFGSSFAHLRGPLREAAECAATNPLIAAVIDCAQKLVACAHDGQPARQAQLPFRTVQLTVSVIQCNDAPPAGCCSATVRACGCWNSSRKRLSRSSKKRSARCGARRHSPIRGRFSKPANASRRPWQKAFLPLAPANWRPAASRARIAACVAASASPPM